MNGDVLSRIDPQTLGFDIDGVIADTMTLFVRMARQQYGVQGLRYEDITCYALADCLAMDPAMIDDIISRILDGRHDIPLHPVDGAPEVLGRIGRLCGPVVLVTARSKAVPIREWILGHIPLQPEGVEVIATGDFDGKAEALRSRGVSHFVEDRLETCFQLSEAGIVPVVFRQPWNRHPHPFAEVGSWKELEDLIAFP